MPHQGEGDGNLDDPDSLEICAAQHAFDWLAAAHGDSLDLSGTGSAKRLQADFLSPNIFKVTGGPFILGRPFTEEEDIPPGPCPEASLFTVSWTRRSCSVPCKEIFIVFPV